MTSTKSGTLKSIDNEISFNPVGNSQRPLYPGFIVKETLNVFSHYLVAFSLASPNKSVNP